jgi:hypothetical protein
LAAEDPLPSWSDGPARTSILEFVRSVGEPGAAFVPEPERIASFDNDGTLWCEKPLHVQAAARRPQMIDTGTGHIGFRCVSRLPAVRAT